MIIGIGIDIVELERIEQLMMKNEKFIDRILTEEEKRIFFQLSPKRKVEFLAGRFAAKEAYAKAIGTGIGKNVSFHDIQIMNDDNGKPIVVSNGKDCRIHVSISHSRDYAIAQVIIERLS
ncbi:holo-ACP synthase [Geobacillus sp. NFOSA3]|jgi:holo-[acyl-carrier protein] synthase|uniref:Holo-[acyl-carrier-protein] synthase n=3 Tax=Anoxybacillaceae TaxID=3120669 RepID=ACPS_GEOSW|nr:MULTISPECIES: holo-ACP synthase [Bacillaceae]C5D4D1.1 RecName: Full=Holo-[acyl-carrier-protein] synthase; Short=Holo-ACP synthase; AltName: Full=4'-phosphopantetheinyl transferase AcpS [Geobacillus sp. WCH70]NNU94607.1 holo-ACP synthase [Geobacillus sp. NFOSA3]PDM39640.1 holo-ACP synthase [Parageobacillus yumthangensis]TXK89645.1 holo-ACP synthase [Parageobacillus sp. SY1]KYD25306.1 Holo-[acyl-carrier protein] synthase [Parageobacillus toebii]MED4971155.1 holo-ACP synthase [Parageobacillus